MQTGLGLVDLNNFSRFWDLGAVLSCLVPGSGMSRGEEYCLLEPESLTEKVVQRMGPGLLSFHMKGYLVIYL